MPTHIKHLLFNRKVIFDFGTFDKWCVFVVEKNGKKYAPYDVDYFSDLQKLSHFYGTQKIYDDFVAIYDLTTNEIDAKVLNLIDEIMGTYEVKHQELIEQWLTVLYAGMIAEENKEGAILKKRIKRLGMYQILMLKYDPTIAANFSKGKKWKVLDKIMTPLGF